ncbi:hypothetical protein Ancab_035167 [Ancistrocladus abbreviatus]
MEREEMKPQLKKKGLWKPEEDMILKKYVEAHGEGNWGTVSKKSGLMRGGKSCRLRWKNYLSPNIKRGSMSKEEEDLIIRLHKLLGNRWSLIAGRLPGRTDNGVKNYWNTHLNKKNNRHQAAKSNQSTNFSNNDNDDRSNQNQKNTERQNFQPNYQQPVSTSENSTSTATADGNTHNNDQEYLDDRGTEDNQGAPCCYYEMMASFPVLLQPIKEDDNVSMAFMCDDDHLEQLAWMPTLWDGGFLSEAFGYFDWGETYMHNINDTQMGMP